MDHICWDNHYFLVTLLSFIYCLLLSFCCCWQSHKTVVTRNYLWTRELTDFFHLAVKGANLDVTLKHVQWQIWYFPLDLTLSRNQPCSSRPNKHYSVSEKSMRLSLLFLIGLRRNQIECDNCVPVTFPLRHSETGGRRALREGRGMSVSVYVHYLYTHVRSRKEAPEAPPCSGATVPQVWCPSPFFTTALC